MTREKLLRYGKDYLRDLETACCEIDELHLNFVRESIKALDQEPCDDCISREAVLDLCDSKDEEYKVRHFREDVECLPPVTPQPTMGHWVLTQRDKYIDINCSECGNTRIKEYAYNYAVEDISEQEFRDYIEKNKMNFCECCGVKMEVEE